MVSTVNFIIWPFVPTQDARRSTEFAVIGKFKLKLTGITETASYNWVTTTASQQPSQYVEEIIQFLVSNFQILTIVHSLTVSVCVCVCVCVCACVCVSFTVQ